MLRSIVPNPNYSRREPTAPGGYSPHYGKEGILSESAVFYRSPGDDYPTIVRGSGVYLWDADGKQYLDLSSGLSSTAGIGHGRADIAAAMADQAARLSFVHNAKLTNDRQEEYIRCSTSTAAIRRFSR